MSHEKDKNKVPFLDDKSDYRLWRVRVDALCDSEHLGECLSKENPFDKATEEYSKTEGLDKKSSNITVRSLINRMLRVKMQNIYKPCQMLRKLDELYDSKSTSTKTSKMTELVTMRNSTIEKISVSISVRCPDMLTRKTIWAQLCQQN